MTKYYVRMFFNRNGPAPNQMALMTWNKGKTSRDLEISVAKGRPDIGRVEWATHPEGPWADA